MKVCRIILLTILLPLAVNAAEPLKLTNAPTPEKRFIPLNGARTEQKTKSMPLGKEHKPLLLRSDSQRMKDGHMRIDRNRAVAIAPQHAIIRPDIPGANAKGETKPATETQVKPEVKDEPVTVITPEMDGDIARESEEIVGNKETYDNPVLSLFDSGDSSLPSFSEAMRGGGRTIAGRHRIWPIPLTIAQSLTSGYGMRTDPFHGRQAFHGGIDIAVPTGTPVLATADGQVMQVATDANYGKYIAIQHNDGTLSRYGHLSGQVVTEGQTVRAGQTIGAVGSTGRSTGAHLDYRVSKNGVKFDPLMLLSMPANVASNGIKPPSKTKLTTQAAARLENAATKKIATNATARRAMVIQVR